MRIQWCNCKQGTLFDMLQKRNPNLFGLSVSCTTRGPRTGEIDGKHYYFVSMEEFTKVNKELDEKSHTKKRFLKC